MGLKKYEIITVGSDKRVRALRSWQVGDRYVNIGDVGGIVYDEKTLSQDGLCWLFRGNFGFPGARIGGDSIVDVGETTLGATGAPAVDILGSSVVVCSSKLRLESDQTAADAVVLTEADFEQGFFNYTAGANWETWKGASNNYVRSKAPIFLGGAAKTLKLSVPGFVARVWVLDRDGIGVTPVIQKTSGAGVTLGIPAGYQYFIVQIVKDPFAPTVPADATTAQITFTGTYETKLSVIDSRVEINPANSTNTVFVKPGGSYTMAPGVKYPEYIIRNSKVSINVPAAANKSIRLMGQIIGSTALLDCTTENLTMAGTYSNIKNLTASGVLTANADARSYNIIQAADCDNFAVSPTIFPGLAAAQTANMPFVFQGCNVPDGRFYHHAQIANTYRDINFDLATADLGKLTVGGIAALTSSNVNGMYRLSAGGGDVIGALVESHESVKGLNLVSASNAGKTYNTTIYKDAYFNGLFDIAGTNVFGNTMKHEASNTQDVSGVLVKGLFNATTNGSTISGVVANNARAVVSQPFRVSGAGGVLVSSPAGLECNIYLTDAANKIIVNTGYVSGTNAPIVPALPAVYAYVAVRKADGSDILSLDEIKGVTVTVYNGCKIVNTGETAVNMKGNIRVEGNATLTNCSIIGTGYFGGNAVLSGMSVNGYAYMKDNTLCTKTSENVQTFASLVMEGNAVYNSIASLALTGLKVFMYDKSKMLGDLRSASPVLIMRDNATIAAGGELSGASIGIVTVKDDAVIDASISFIGDITLCGSYNGNTIKTWTGKRVIDNHNAPAYDNNVKTQYDF